MKKKCKKYTTGWTRYHSLAQKRILRETSQIAVRTTFYYCSLSHILTFTFSYTQFSLQRYWSIFCQTLLTYITIQIRTRCSRNQQTGTHWTLKFLRNLTCSCHPKTSKMLSKWFQKLSRESCSRSDTKSINTSRRKNKKELKVQIIEDNKYISNKTCSSTSRWRWCSNMEELPHLSKTSSSILSISRMLTWCQWVKYKIRWKDSSKVMLWLIKI